MQEIREDGRDPNLEDLKKMIRHAAKEKNDPVFGSILDPANDTRNKERSRNKPPGSKKTGKGFVRKRFIEKWSGFPMAR